MSNRMKSSTSLKNPTGFLFNVKHKANSSGSSKFVPIIDLSKPLIKHKAKTASHINSKNGGRKTRKKSHKKTYRKKHIRKSHKKIYYTFSHLKRPLFI